jgi:uncharacterized membrane protein YphA (DoxX/SURF4 family)
MIRQYAWGLLILRLVLGFNFFMHGFSKFSGGIENTARWFDSLGLPGILAYGVALLEVLGGFGLMAGLFTRFLGVLYIIVMIVAIYKVQFVRGFLGGYELELTFLAISLALAVSGGGLYSMDHALFPSRKLHKELEAERAGRAGEDRGTGKGAVAVEGAGIRESARTREGAESGEGAGTGNSGSGAGAGAGSGAGAVVALGAAGAVGTAAGTGTRTNAGANASSGI